MRRREFITGIAILIAAQGVARAQARRTMRKIGCLHAVSTHINPPLSLSSLRRVWRGLGYVEGETVLVRGAEGDPSRLPKLAAELIGLEVGVLIAIGPAALRAANEATNTTPIVAIDLETDPIRAGLAATFGRPGGNVTGLFLDQGSGSSY